MRTVEQIQAYIANARVSLADYWVVYNQMEADGEPNTRFLERKTGIIKLYINTIQSFIDNKPEDVEQVNKLFNALLSYLPSNFLGLSYTFYNPLASGIVGDVVIGAVLKATQSVYGIVRLSYPSVDINDPIVVSNSDPRITQWDAAYTLSNELYDERITAVSVNSAGNIVITKADATEFTSSQSVILNQFSAPQSASMWISGNARVDGNITAAGLANTGQQPLVLVADANGLLKKRTLEEFKVDVGSGVRTVAGTENQVLVNGGTTAQDGNITLSLPQSIATTSDVQFNNGSFRNILQLTSTTNSDFYISGAAGYNRGMYYATGGVLRWAFTTNSEAESGSNAGSNFVLARYNDAGVKISDAFRVNRATNAAEFVGSLTANSIIKFGGLSTQFLKADGSVDSNTYLTGNQTITLSGEASGSGATAIAVTLSNSAVISKLLTGYVSGAGVVSATDSILTAIQKLNGNIGALVTGVSSVFGRTGAVTAQSGDYTTAQVTESGNLYFTNARARASISETITGIDYDSNTGVFSLTAGYVIPTTTSAANWDTAYANRITSLTTIGSSGAATLISNVLNIPNYTLSGLGGVPYTGATTNVDLGEYGIKAGYFAYDTTPTSIPTAQGSTYWDVAEETIEIIMNGAKQHIGLDTFYNVKNSTGVTIPKGTAVRFAGTDGGSGHLLIAPFLANGTYPSTYYMGITAEDIANGDFGKVMQFGKLRNIDTSAFTNGDILYASTTVAGGFQTTAPVAPNNIVIVAAVVHASNNGTLVVRATLGSNINSDEGVKITSPATGQLLQLQASGLWENKSVATILGGTSSQFVKGDGSLDSNVYLTGNQTITLSGEASGSGATSISVTLVNSAVIGKVLTGLSITGGAITSSDTILSAFGKVQNQINGLMGGVIYKGTYNASTNTPTLSDGAGTQGWYYVVSVAGTQNFGSGNISFNIGDWAIYNGSIWEKVDNTDSVTSVNGQIGAVVLTTSDITEGTNLYYTNARGIGSTLTGYVSGAGTITAADSILSAIQKLNGNVSALVTGVSSVSGTSNRITVSPTSGAVVVDIASNYAGQNTITTVGTIGTGVWQGTAIADAYISSASTWNAKIGGSGTNGTFPIFTSSGTIGDSNITQVGLQIVYTNRDLQILSSTPLLWYEDSTATDTGFFTYANAGVFAIAKASTAGSNIGDILRLDRATGAVSIVDTPTTSAGAFDLITRNTSTGVLEKVASNYYATAGSISGTTGRLAKFTSSGAVGDSIVSESGGKIGLNVTPTRNLHLLGGVDGGILVQENASTTSIPVNGLSLTTGFNVSYLSSRSTGVVGGVADLAYSAKSHIFDDGSTVRMSLSATELITFGAPDTGEAHIFGGSARVNGNFGINGSPTTYGGYGSISANGTNGGVFETLVNGTSSLLLFSNDSYTAFVEQRNLPIQFQTNNVNRLYIGASGNVLIGTTTDASGYKLQVAGLQQLIGANTLLNFGELDANNTYFQGLNLAQNASKGIVFFGTSEYGRFSSSGNFLLGTTTDAGYKLDVNGTARVSGVATFFSGAGSPIIIRKNASFTGAHYILFQNVGESQIAYMGYGSGSSDNFQVVNSLGETQLYGGTSLFALGFNGAESSINTSFKISGTNNLTIQQGDIYFQASGRGLLSPDANRLVALENGLMTINGAMNATLGTNLTLGIKQLTLDNYSNEGVGITFNRTTSADDLMAIGVADSSLLGLFSRSGIIFTTGGTTNYSATTERMRITDGGNVGIGTASPLNRLVASNSTTYNVENSYAIAAAGNDVAYKLVLGYDETLDAGVISSVRTAVGWKDTWINPNGGAIRFGGTGVFNQGLIINSGTLQVNGNNLQFDQSGVRSWNIFASGGELNFTSGDNLGVFDFIGNIRTQSHTLTAGSTLSVAQGDIYIQTGGYGILSPDTNRLLAINNGFLTINGTTGIGVTSVGSDGGVMPRLAVGNPSNSDKFVGIVYDNTYDTGFIHSIHRATAWKNIAIQAFGGQVLVGTPTATANDKMQIHSGGDSTLRMTSSDNTSFRGLVFGSVSGDVTEYAYLKYKPQTGELRMYGSPTGFGGFVSFYNNNIEEGRISVGGRWLLGTTTDNGVDKLQVNGSARVNGTLQVNVATGYNALFQQSGTDLRINYLNQDLSANVSAAYRAVGYTWQDNGGSAIMSLSATELITFGATDTGEAHIFGGGGRFNGNLRSIGRMTSEVLTSGASYFEAKNTSGSSYFGNDSIGAYIITEWNAPILFYTNNVVVGRWSASGNFGVGVNPTNAKLEVVATTGEVFRADASGGAYRIIANQTDVLLGGNVGIGTTSPSSYSFNDPAFLVVANTSGNSTLSIVSSTTGIGYLAFADGTTGTDRYSGSIFYSHSTDTMSFKTAGSDRLEISSTGAATFSSSVQANSYITSGGRTTSYGFRLPDWQIYNTSGGALAFNNYTTDFLTIASGGSATFSQSVTATSFVKTGGTSAQFLKADGSVDSSTYLTTSAAATGYIQNQFASAQTASMWVSGDIKTNSRVYVGTNGCYIEEVLVGSTYELRVVDSAGNTTVIS